MKRILGFALILAIGFISAGYGDEVDSVMERSSISKIHPDKYNYYEVNIRQFTKEGTFKAFEKHLSRIKKMGVDVICLIPIYPIGAQERKGTLGDPYFIRNYKDINRALGNRDEFKNMIRQAHDLDMKVVLDWDSYQMSADNIWSKNMQWFNKGETSKYVYPNYNQDDMCDAMREAMSFWVHSFDIDGFRCMQPDKIPTWYWEDTWKLLSRKRKMIAIAKSDNRALFDRGFNVLMPKGLYEIIEGITREEKTGRDLDAYMESRAVRTSDNAFYLNYISNYFENTYRGPLRDRIGNSTKLMTILTIMVNGNPLIFNGQEAGMSKSLSCCEKDEIPWYSYIREPLFTKLLQLRHDNPAMLEGGKGGAYQRIESTDNGAIVAFQRQSGKHRVIVLMNVSNTRRLFKFTDEMPTDLPMYDLFTGAAVDLSQWNGKYKDIQQWGYHIYTTK